MFESKRKTIEEQTLIIDDAKLVDVRVSGKGTIDVSYVMEREDAEIRLTVSMQRTHAVDIAKKLAALNPDQVRAMHARIAAQEEPTAPVKEQPATKEEAKPLERPKEEPKPAPRVIKLEPGPSQPMNWKDSQLSNKGTRLSDEQIEHLLHSVFRYRVKYRHYNKTNRAFETFQHYIEVTLPKQFKISKDVARHIYAGRSYTHVTLGYGPKWGAFIKEMTKHGLVRQIPRYLMERWSNHRYL